MSRLETWMSHASTLLVGASGIAYLWMKYFQQTDDPFALINHPLQPAMLSIHILAAPVVTFVVGMVVNTHVRKKLAGSSGSNRLSGLGALITFPAMVISGYALQVSTNEVLKQVLLAIHLASSGVFLLTYLSHQIVTILLRRPLSQPA